MPLTHAHDCSMVQEFACIVQIPLLGSQASSSLPLFQAGEIYQEFTSDGQVKNIIQASIPYLLEEGKDFNSPTLM